MNKAFLNSCRPGFLVYLRQDKNKAVKVTKVLPPRLEKKPMIYYMKCTVLSLALLLSSLFCSGQASPKYAREQVTKDLHYLYASLKEAHYDAFAYTTEEENELAYRKAKASIPKDSLT